MNGEFPVDMKYCKLTLRPEIYVGTLQREQSIAYEVLHLHNPSSTEWCLANDDEMGWAATSPDNDDPDDLSHAATSPNSNN